MVPTHYHNHISSQPTPRFSALIASTYDDSRGMQSNITLYSGLGDEEIIKGEGFRNFDDGASYFEGLHPWQSEIRQGTFPQALSTDTLFLMKDVAGTGDINNLSDQMNMGDAIVTTVSPEQKEWQTQNFTGNNRLRDFQFKPETDRIVNDVAVLTTTRPSDARFNGFIDYLKFPAVILTEEEAQQYKAVKEQLYRCIQFKKALKSYLTSLKKSIHTAADERTEILRAYQALDIHSAETFKDFEVMDTKKTDQFLAGLLKKLEAVQNQDKSIPLTETLNEYDSGILEVAFDPSIPTYPERVRAFNFYLKDLRRAAELYQRLLTNILRESTRPPQGPSPFGQFLTNAVKPVGNLLQRLDPTAYCSPPANT